MKIMRWCVFLCLLGLISGGRLNAQLVYVDQAAVGANDGSSWSNAYTNLQDALGIAAPGFEIWVAAGEYVPGLTTDTTFLLRDSVAVYGGFAGGETNRFERDWIANETVLSGDVNGDDEGFLNSVDNVRHVVSGTNNAVLDGFTITGGNATDTNVFLVSGGGMLNMNSTNLVVANCVFIHNQALAGGAVYSEGGDPHFINCRFINNRATAQGWAMGGAVDSWMSAVVFSNCVFAANEAADKGGAVSMSDCAPLFIHSLFVGNYCGTDAGGAIYLGDCNTNSLGLAEIINCTFADNQSLTYSEGGALYFYSTNNATIKNSIFWENKANGAIKHIYSVGPLPIDISYSALFGALPMGPYNHGTGILDVGTADFAEFWDTGTWDSPANYNPTNRTSRIYDGARNWATNSLVGYYLEPKLNDLRRFPIVANDATSLTVLGDLSGMSLLGMSYGIQGYHLQSTAGRYDPGLMAFTNDAFDSICIDAGDPGSDYAQEPLPNGGRINMGAYGGTPQASKSSGGGTLSVTVSAPSGITTNSASLNGDLVDTGGSIETHIWVCYGTNDFGEVSTNDWMYVEYIGSFSVTGPVMVHVTNLWPDTQYFYRIFASNEFGSAWSAAPAVTNFWTQPSGGGGDYPYFKVYGIPDAVLTGTPQTVTVEAWFGTNQMVNYTGTVSFTSRDAMAVLPSDYTFLPADNGVRVFTNGVEFYTAGQFNDIEVTDWDDPGMTGDQHDILVYSGYTDTAEQFVIWNYPWRCYTGELHSVSVAAVDHDWNLATNYTGTVLFSSSDTIADLPESGTASYTFTSGDAGWHTFSNDLQFNTIGIHWLKVEDSINTNIWNTQWDVIAMGYGSSTQVSHLVVSGRRHVTIGETNQIQVMAHNIYEQLVEDFTGNVDFDCTDTNAVYPSSYFFTTNDQGYVSLDDALAFYTTGTHSFSATWSVDTNITGVLEPIEVDEPWFGFGRLRLELPPVALAGRWETFTLKVYDSFGYIDTNFTGEVTFLPENPADDHPGSYNFTGTENGVKTFTNALRFTEAGEWGISVEHTDTGMYEDNDTMVLMAGATNTTHFEVFVEPGIVLTGENYDMLVVALGDGGFVNTNHTGQVDFTLTGGTFTVNPFNSWFDGIGWMTNQVSFSTAGTHDLIAALTSDTNVYGRISLDVLDPTTVWFVNGQKGSDTNSGIMAEAAFGTIQFALTQMTQGDCLIVAGGDYDEGTIAPAMANSQVGQRTAIIGDDDGRYFGHPGPVRIIGPGFGVEALRLDGQYDFVLSELEFNVAAGDTNLSVLGCENVLLAGIECNGGQTGVHIENSTNALLIECDVEFAGGAGVLALQSDGVHIEKLEVESCDVGVKIMGPASSTAVIEKSFIYGNGYAGVVVMDATAVIRFSEISSNAVYGVYGSNTAGDIDVLNNLIVDNPGSGIYLTGASTYSVLRNNTICGSGLGLHVNSTMDVTMRNNIVAYNTGTGVVKVAAALLNDYNCVYGNTVDWSGATPGVNDINADPLFAGAGDYHLMSAAGRWTPNGYVMDGITSPCIDAGDPLDDYENEPQPNGGRINMGAFGNTREASKSSGVLYDITASAGHGGFISPTGMVWVAEGSNMTFTITPVPHYVIDDVWVNGSPIGPTNEYTFENVMLGGQTIEAHFSPADTMALIPAGSFVMGDVVDGSATALPLHTNYLSAYFIDKYETTKALWDEVHEWAVTNGYAFSYAGGAKAADHPVLYINWHDAVKWCNARSEKEGLTPAYYTDVAHTTIYRSGTVGISNNWVNWHTGYRLPTEAEWEKAARGGVPGHRFPWDDTNTISHARANFYNSGGEPYAEGTLNAHPVYDGPVPGSSPVGAFTANGYGLYDMAGNAFEWCWDTYDSAYYADSPVYNPLGPEYIFDRVLRGGSWSFNASYTRAAYRHSSGPGAATWNVGFRSVLPGVAVQNLSPEAVATNSAILRGELQGTGPYESSADVTIYWGTTDGGTIAGAWDNAEPMGPLGTGSFSNHLAALNSATTYYYRSFASNASSSAWAPFTTNFTTAAAWYDIIATAWPGGTIAPSGTVWVIEGGSTNFVFTPDVGYHISDVWIDGSPIGPTNSYTFFNVTNSGHTIEAYFDVNYHTLTVTSAHGSPSYDGVTTQSWGFLITAWVDADIPMGTTQYVCTGWTGTGSVPGSGTSNAVDFVHQADSTLTWLWGTNYWLEVMSDPNGSVDVTSDWYAAGSNLLLTATASNGYHFVNWSGDIVSTNNPLPVVMNSAFSVTANFALNTNSIFTTSPYGTPTPATGTTWHTRGTLIDANIWGSPYADGVGTQRVCTGWTATGDAPPSGLTTNFSFVLSNNSTIAWQWQTEVFLTMGSAVNGSVDVADGWYVQGTNLIITATPSNHYAFAGWSGDIISMDNPLNLPMSQTYTLSPLFTVKTNSLEVISPMGMATPPQGTNWYTEGSLLSASIDDSPLTSGSTQYVCVGWSGTGDVPVGGSFTNTGSFVLSNNSTVVWQWQTNYWLDISTDPNGSVDVMSDWYSAGSNLLLTATANSNWTFIGWSGDITTNDNPLAVQIDGPLSLVPNFVPADYDISATAWPGGSIAPSGTVWVAYGADQTFTITPDTGYHISDVWIDGSPIGPTNSYTFFNVTNFGHTIEAYFDADQHTLTVNSFYGTPMPEGVTTNAWGTPVNARVDASVPMGTTQYVCTGWTGTGSVPGSGTSNAVDFVHQADSTLTWLWGTNYWLEVTAAANGSVDVASQWATADSSVNITATADSGYQFAGWGGNVPPAQSNDNPLALLMDQPRQITPNFVEESGSVSVSLIPAEAVAAGAQWRLTAGPDTGWKNSGDTVAGLTVAGSPYTVTFLDITGWTRQQDMTDIMVQNSTVTNRVGEYMLGDMVLIPGGTFEMGISGGSGGHTVTLSAFYLDVKPVTVGQFIDFCNDTGGVMPAPPTWGWGDTNLPMVNVTWNQANAYALWAGKRLPTEAEFEYAMRSGFADRTYPWGNTINAGNANYNRNVGQPTQAGAYPVSTYGLYDIAGNVWEWNSDWYQDILTGPVTDPTGPGSGTYKMIRGGSYATRDTRLQCAWRFYYTPDTRNTDLGFRCAKNVPKGSASGGDEEITEIPEWWEEWHFGDGSGNEKTTGFDPDADSDGDGLSDGDEYAAGTDPNDAGSVFAVDSVTVTTDGVSVKWQSVSGKTYTLQRSSDLMGGFSTIDSGIAATAPQNSYLDHPEGDGPWFYRVVVE